MLGKLSAVACKLAAPQLYTEASSVTFEIDGEYLVEQLHVRTYTHCPVSSYTTALPHCNGLSQSFEQTPWRTPSFHDGLFAAHLRMPPLVWYKPIRSPKIQLTVLLLTQLVVLMCVLAAFTASRCRARRPTPDQLWRRFNGFLVQQTASVVRAHISHQAGGVLRTCNEFFAAVVHRASPQRPSQLAN